MSESRRSLAHPQRSLWGFARLAGLAGGVLLTLTACGERRLKLDAETLDERLDWVDADVPLCETPDAAATRAALTRASATMADLARRARPLARSGSLRAAGSCGGSVEFTSDHAHGNTDYVVTFDAFCIQTDDGAVLTDGVLEATEEGNPTPNGPMIKALELRTDGPVELTHRARLITLELDRARTEYGNPSTFAPDAPTAENPDIITVTRGSMTYDSEREDYVRQVRISRIGGNEATVHIERGEVGTVGEGQVSFQTPPDEPLVVNLSGGDVLTGAVEFTGAGGTVVRVEPTSGLGVFTITLNGEPHDRALDCSKGTLPMIEAGLTLFSVLPLH